MMRKVWLAIAMASVATGAAADIFKCPDANGHVTYSNVQSKGCTRLISGGTESPAGGKGGKATPSAPTPPNFPKVDGAKQRARDEDRRRILENEVAAEQKSLDDAKKALVEQEGLILPTERIAGGGIKGGAVEERLKQFRDSVALHERNLEALKKEIGNLR